MFDRNDEDTPGIIGPPARRNESQDVVVAIKDVALFAFYAGMIHTAGKHAKWTRGQRFHRVDSIDFVSLDASWVIPGYCIRLNLREWREAPGEG